MDIVLVTGASRGMGLVTAEHLAEHGCCVLAAVRDPTALAERSGIDLGTGLDGGGRTRLARRPGVQVLALDVTDDDSVTAAAARVRSELGVLDVLINNAAVPGTPAPAEQVTPADFAAVLATDLLGPVRVTQAFLPLLRISSAPRLVMVSSGMGSLTLQSNAPEYRDIAHLPYPAAKAGLNMLAVQYAKALPDVLVTAVDPGLTATEFTGFSGHSVHEGARAVITAALDTTGPSGRFMDRHGPLPW